MTWFTIPTPGVSAGDTFFGDTVNKIDNMFNGLDILDTVVINSNVTWTFNSLLTINNNIVMSGTINTHIIPGGTGTFTLDGHTHVKADITDFTHTHVKADITDFAHVHPQSEITDLVADLAAKLDDITGENIGDLSDVTITSPVIRHAVIHDGAGQFINRLLIEADISDLQSYITGITGENFESLSDIPTHASGSQILQRNSGDSAFEWITTPSNIHNSITEGDSDATINDSGTGTFDLTLDSFLHYKFETQKLTFNAENGTAIIELEGNHTTPAQDQVISQIDIYDDDADNNRTLYAQIETIIADPTAFDESATMTFNVNSQNNVMAFMTINPLSNLGRLQINVDLDMDSNGIVNVDEVQFGSSPAPVGSLAYIHQLSGTMELNVATGASINLSINGTPQITLSGSALVFNGQAVSGLSELTFENSSNQNGVLNFDNDDRLYWDNQAGTESFGLSVNTSDQLQLNSTSGFLLLHTGWIDEQTSHTGGIDAANDRLLVYDQSNDDIRQISISDVVGGATQTPWAQDIDAANFNLDNLGHLIFNEGSTSPAGTEAYIDWNTNVMTTNLPTGDVFRWEVNGVTKMQLSAGNLSMADGIGFGLDIINLDKLTMNGTLSMTDQVSGTGYIIMNSFASPGNSGFATRGRIFMDSGNSNHLSIRRNDGIDVDLEAGGEFTGPMTGTHDYDGETLDNFGILISNATNPATAGEVRLGEAEEIVWRNNANDGNLVLNINASDELVYEGIVLGAAGSGDMILATIQTVTALKTFEDTTFGLRNVADTFTASFLNTITADRIYTLPDEAGIISLIGRTETLVGKTLTTPTISGTGYTNAQHGHLAADSGGQITEASISDLGAYITISSVDVFTNKSYDADGTGNVLTNIGSSEIKSEMITGFGTVTGVSGDFVLISDTDDGGNLKKVDVLDFLAGSGDMILANTQTVTGPKTFEDTTLLLRNVADTFNGSFLNTNTADRVYTLPDIAGTIALTNGNTYTGAHLYTAATIRIPLSATPTMAVDGDFAIDTDLGADFSHGFIKYYDGEELGVIAMPIAEFTSPTDGHLISYNATNDEFELVAPGGGSGDVVGPGSSTDNAIVIYDSTTGKLIQNNGTTGDGPIIIDDDARVTGIRSLQWTLHSVGFPSPSVAYVQFGNSGTGTNDLEFNVPTASEFGFHINGSIEYNFTPTDFLMLANNIVQTQAYHQMQSMSSPASSGADAIGRLFLDSDNSHHVTIQRNGVEVDLEGFGTGTISDATGSVLDRQIPVYVGTSGLIIDEGGQGGFPGVTIDTAGGMHIERGLTFGTTGVHVANAEELWAGSNQLHIGATTAVNFDIDNNVQFKVWETFVDFMGNFQANINYSDYDEITIPADPSANHVRLYGKLDGGVTKLFYLQEDSVEVGPLGTATGDVVGPGSSVDNGIAIFDSTTGKIIQNSGSGAQDVTIDDNSNVQGVRSLQFSGWNTPPSTALHWIQYHQSNMHFNTSVGNYVFDRAGTRVLTLTNNVMQIPDLDFVLTNSQHIQWTSSASKILYDTGGFIHDVPTGETFSFDVDGTPELIIGGSNVTLGSNDLILSGVGAFVQMEEEAADPSAGTTSGKYYVKEVGGLAKPFFIGDGTAAVDLSAGGGETFTWTADHSLARFNAENVGTIDFHLSGPTVTPASTQPYIMYDTVPTPDGMKINVPGAREIALTMADVREYEFTNAAADWFGNQLHNVSVFSTNGTVAAAGAIRMGNNEFLSWRNAANSADHRINFNTADELVISITSGTDYSFSDSEFDVGSNRAINALSYGLSSSGSSQGNTVNNIWATSSGMNFNTVAVDSFTFRENNNIMLTIDRDEMDFVDLQNIVNLGDINTHTVPSGSTDLADIGGTQIFTNKSYDLGGAGNVLTGSLAEFNTALQTESFAILGANTFTADQDLGGNNIDNVQNIIHDQSSITYAATLDFDFDEDEQQTLTLTGVLSTLTTSNRAAGKSKTVFITGDTSDRVVTFNTSWKTNPSSATVTVLADTFGILTFGCTGTGEADVWVAFAEFDD